MLTTDFAVDRTISTFHRIRNASRLVSEEPTIALPKNIFKCYLVSY